MDQIGVFDAKMHLSKLIDRASRGETIVITRNGRPMAKLTCADRLEARPLSCDDALALLRGIRSRTTSGSGVSMRDLIEEGRRF